MSENLLGILSSVLGDYLNLKADDFRKRTVEGLAVGFSRALSIIILAMLLMLILFVISFALIVLIGNAIGSWSGAAFIVGGVYLVAFAVLYMFRKRLFIGLFAGLFEELIADRNQGFDWKSVLLTIVRHLHGEQQ